MSHHLLSDFETAYNILETFRSSQTVENFDYKHSEFLLYQNQVIAESGDYDKALKHLEQHQSQILDKMSMKEIQGDLCLKLERFDRAMEIFKELITRNPDNGTYFMNYIRAKQLTSDEDIISLYKEMNDDFPQSLCVRRLPLDVAKGEVFEQLICDYLKRNLRKGVPPLFKNIRSLYKDESKTKIIEKLILEFCENLKTIGYFTKKDQEENLPVEPASALLWVYYFIAQHFDQQDDVAKALEYIDLAIEHTPTLIELFVMKGRIYKHAGDPQEAFKWLDEAQSLDTADRFINSKCAKYMLRANKIKDAEEMCGKFTREGVPAMENLNEMQCMWFQTECALAYQRMGQWGNSLKKCHEIERHFDEIVEDQFDFHTYCLRKMTLRSYIELLRLENRLRDHPFYFKAAKCAIEVYIKLFDEPLQSDSSKEEMDIENLSPAELKKLKNKQRKAQKKAELESAEAAKAEKKKEQFNKTRQHQNQDSGDPEAPQLDELIPEKLERPEDPLGKAIDFLKPLQMLSQGLIETHLLAFEIFYRKNKLLIMLMALKRAYSIDSNDARLHGCIIRFIRLLNTSLPTLNETLKTVIDREMQNDLKFLQRKPDELNEEYLAANVGSADAFISSAEVSVTTKKAFELLRNAVKLNSFKINVSFI
jgi:peptide alpha-N-acetyltransferase